MKYEDREIDRTRTAHVIYRCGKCERRQREATGKRRAVVAKRLTYTVTTKGVDLADRTGRSFRVTRSGYITWTLDGKQVERYPRQRPGVPSCYCECGSLMYAKGEVRGQHNEEIACDARCQGATGHACECSCGGANHGKAHAA